MSTRRKKAAKARNTALIICTIAAAAASAVLYARKKVSENVTAQAAQNTIKSESVSTGSLSTTVTGSGTLSSVDATDVTVPSGVTVSEVFCEAGDKVEEGDLLFSVDSASVLSTMQQTQSSIDTLDAKLESAKSDEVSTSLTSNISGRVKKIYAQEDDSVSSVMAAYGSLMVLSLDGSMAVDVDTSDLAVSDTVTVTTSGGEEYTGTVDHVSDGKATILLTDDGPEDGDTVTVTYSKTAASQTEDSGSSEEETEAEEASLTGTLYIHSPLSITGYAGTVESIDVSENESISADTSLITLTDTAYSANYDTLLQQREDLEDTLKELITLYRKGGVYAEFAGQIDSVADAYTSLITDSTSSQSDTASQTDTASKSSTASQSAATSQSAAATQSDGTSSGTAGSANASDAASASDSSSASDDSSSDSTVLTMDPDKQMTINVSVDESDILSVKTGQSAEVTIDSLGTDTYSGTVTEVDTMATSSSGVSSYTALVTIDKTDSMLSGMSASVSIITDSVENALLVPADAVHQTSSTAYVYTSYDEESGELGGMTEVTVGMTDGSKTVIESGLSEGDTVYYESDSSSSDSMMGAMNGMMGGQPGDMGGGQNGDSQSSRPGSGGGQMPSGGGMGGQAGDPGQ